jgi:hypothetical protein
MVMVYNNSGLVVYVMTHNDPKTVKSEEEKSTLDWRDIRGLPFTKNYFPRIIREFFDGVDEEPAVYGRFFE